MNGSMSLSRRSGGLGVWVLLSLLTWPSGGQADGAGEFTCFIYHRFGDDRYPSTNIALDVFAAQLSFLRDQGFKVLTLGAALEQLDSDGGLSERTVVLTVDDGYRSFLTGALPLLRRFGFAATLFINTDSVGRPGYMTWDDLVGLAAEGEVEVDPSGLNAASLQFFVQGQPQSLQRLDPADPGRLLLLRADKPLTGRRTLYTLTAPSADGRVWHWFSHVWVRPEVEE